jgi:hypothetical protein
MDNILISFAETQQWDKLEEAAKTVADSKDLKVFFNPSMSLHLLYLGCYYRENIQLAQNIFSLYEYCCPKDESLIRSSNYLLELMRLKGYSIIGTTDPERKPNNSKEVIIIYGNDEYSYHYLPGSFILRRHAKYVFDVTHTSFEYHEAWESVSYIYVMNLTERFDRFMETLRELCLLRAPIHRVIRIAGEKEENSHAGACKSHREAVTHFLNSNKDHCLILEDDVTFNHYTANLLNNLKTFFERKYDYHVALAFSSKFYRIDPYDEILSLSFQECTTTAAYFLSKEGAKRVLPILEEGEQKLREGANPMIYACDRYWAKLQPERKFFVFKEKFGYQRAGYSNITKIVSCHFD